MGEFQNEESIRGNMGLRVSESATNDQIFDSKYENVLLQSENVEVSSSNKHLMAQNDYENGLSNANENLKQGYSPIVSRKWEDSKTPPPLINAHSKGSLDISKKVIPLGSIDEIHKAKKPILTDEDTKLLNKSLILHRDFKQNHMMTSFYLAMNLVRCLIIAFITVLAISSPRSQIIIICLVNTLMLVYLIALRPFKSAVTMISIAMIEILTNMSCYATAYLADKDRSGSEETEGQISAGWVIFVSKLLINFTIAIGILTSLAKFAFRKLITTRIIAASKTTKKI